VDSRIVVVFAEVNMAVVVETAAVVETVAAVAVGCLLASGRSMPPLETRAPRCASSVFPSRHEAIQSWSYPAESRIDLCPIAGGQYRRSAEAGTW